MSAPDVVAAGEQRRARSLPTSAAWCLLIGLGALAQSWHTELSASGRASATGYSTVSAAAPIFALLALLLVAVACLRPDRPAWAGWAAPCAAIVALVCGFGASDGAGAVHDGAGPWVSAWAFGAAAVLSALAAQRAAARR